MAIAEVARKVMSPDRPYYCSQSPSFSTRSSPTSRLSSYRAFFLAPDDCGFNDDLDHHASGLSGFSGHHESFRI
jgi:hypothetical protein